MSKLERLTAQWAEDVNPGRTSHSREAKMPMKYFLAIIAMLFASTAFAQQHVSITIPGQNIKYLVSQNVEVGDVPNHIVRVFDIRDTVPANVTTTD
jgi:hypothetical protein